MKKLLTGAVEIREYPPGTRQACILQTDGTWIPAHLCKCLYDFEEFRLCYSLECPVDRHAIRARMQVLEATDCAGLAPLVFHQASKTQPKEK